jgi:hypothetical protein
MLVAVTLALLITIYGVIALSARTRSLRVKTQFPIIVRSWGLRIVRSFAHK